MNEDEYEGLREQIEECAHEGKVMLTSCGRDCDNVEHFGLTLLDANYDMVSAYIDRIYEQAEGPEYWHIIPPNRWDDTRERVKNFSSRDLNLEAFENGHPHSIRP